MTSKSESVFRRSNLYCALLEGVGVDESDRLGVLLTRSGVLVGLAKLFDAGAADVK